MRLDLIKISVQICPAFVYKKAVLHELLCHMNYKSAYRTLTCFAKSNRCGCLVVSG